MKRHHWLILALALALLGVIAYRLRRLVEALAE
jgi:hypothetical protein